MTWAAIITAITAPIAVLGLGLAIFNSYWTHFRIKRAFYFLRVADLTTGVRPEFALINGGNRDELITSVICIFEHGDRGEATYPKQVSQIGEGSSMLLAAGKACRCKIEFLEPFTSEFALQGRKDEKMGGFYVFPMDVQIEWADMDGKVHRKTVRHSEFGFAEDGGLHLCKPVAQRVDLYAKS